MPVGPSYNADGTTPALRFGKTSEQTVGQAHGKYYEAASRGVMFNACAQAGVAPGTSLGTTACLVLYNPPGSGKRLAIKKVSAGYVSGTLGAGTVFHCVLGTITQTAPSSGTLLVNNCCDVGNANAGVGVVRTGATVVQPVAYRPFFSTGAELATTASAMQEMTEDIDGEIVLEPGCTYQIQGITAAGSTPLIAPGITWEEIPIV